MKKIGLILLICVLVGYSQKKSLTHDDYKLWSVYSNIISNDGKYISTETKQANRRGDKNIELKYLDEDYTFKSNNSTMNGFTSSSDHFIYLINPLYDVVYKKKLKKEKDLPMDTLKVFSLKEKKDVFMDNYVISVSIPRKNSNFIVYNRNKYNSKIDTIYETVPDSLFIGKKGKAQGFKMFYTKNNIKKDEDKINVILDLKTYKPIFFEGKSYYLSETGDKVFFISEEKVNKDVKVNKSDKLPKRQILKYIDYVTKKEEILDSSSNFYTNVRVSKEGNKIAFLYSNDSLKCKEENRKYSLGLIEIDKKNKILKKIIDNKNKYIPKGWEISKYSSNFFSESGDRLFFEVLPQKNKIEKDTNILDSEKPKIDLWSWNDKLIQTAQKVNFYNLSRKDYSMVYLINKDKIVLLQKENDESIIYKSGDEDYFYAQEYVDPIQNMWKSYKSTNFYSINVNTGERKLVLKDQLYGIVPSFKGNYFSFYKDKKWYIYNTKKDNIIDASKDIKENLYDEDFDLPEFAPPYLPLSWSKDEKLFYISDRYDIWAISSENKSSKNITNYYGRDNKIGFSWQNIEDSDFKGFDDKSKIFLLSGLSEETKDISLYKLNDDYSINLVLGERDRNYKFLMKSRDSDKFIYSKEGFDLFQDVYLSDIKLFSTNRLTDINPQQKNFKWGSVELVNWKTFSGKDAQGLLYKPEGFDKTKKYPMIVYFYERNTDTKNSYKIPAPSPSIINISYCVSNDYVIFVPDIRYKVGQPGEDAYDYIISGTDMICKGNYIDTTKIGLQGQSWGGYQTAYLVTRTGKKFAAAMAGAPVSNMTSAYGGIRWTSGANRSMQYENGQSRLGTTMWEDRDKYIQNSPLFFADKVETPLFIMSNDNDGAVPWYQGIEFYIALRRLRKKVWMINYNGEEHNLMKQWNREDFSIRLMQFFDHYLKGSPAPKWMTEGIDQVQKSQEYYGLD